MTLSSLLASVELRFTLNLVAAEFSQSPHQAAPHNDRQRRQRLLRRPTLAASHHLITSMSWFWGKKNEEHEESSSSSEEEEYTSEEEEEEEEDEKVVHVDQQQQVASSAAREEEKEEDHHQKEDVVHEEKDDGEESRGDQPQHEESDNVDEEEEEATPEAAAATPPVQRKRGWFGGMFLRSAPAQTPPPDEEEDASSSSSHEEEEEEDEPSHKETTTQESASPSSAGIPPNESSSLYEDYSSNASNDDDMDEKLQKGVIPNAVQVDSDHPSNRFRADSALSFDPPEGFADDEERSFQNDEDDDEDETRSVKSGLSARSAETEAATTTAEKHALLVLAAEHDRVDILQAILSDESVDRTELLREGIPPLHIAVSYGSVNATNCLMRMGADPSIRPDIKAIREAQKQEGAPPIEVPHINRFDGVTAWELVFGDGTSVQEVKSTGWSLFGMQSSSNLDEDLSESQGGSQTRQRKRKIVPVNIAPSKREGIRHAFTAEALRCIGSDEVDRLRQLLDSGMPASIDIGGKNLYDWAVEMGALQCEELLRPTEAAKFELEMEGEETANVDKRASGAPSQNASLNESDKNLERQRSAVLDRTDPLNETPAQLANRLDELDSLARALSVSLDGLAEEASVCNGLLLMGGGASALASHVRSLKATKERKMDELERIGEAWENSEDELAYWAREGGKEGQQIATSMLVPQPFEKPTRRSSLTPAKNQDEEVAQRRQFKAQIAASEQKVRKLRAAISDLSEVLSRDLEEVEKRGLSGGINLVRGLREEIREIDFQLNEAKNGEATCRTKINLIQSKIHMASLRKSTEMGKNEGATEKPSIPTSVQTDSAPAPPRNETTLKTSATATATTEDERETDTKPASAPPKRSEQIASGQSTAIAVRNAGRQGLFPVSLWQILLRIIGFADERPSPRRTDSSQSHQPVMLL